MTSIYCFSGSGHSLAVAKMLSAELKCEVTRIHRENASTPVEETAVVVFPVYCQNIPSPVKTFLKSLRACYVALIATYGKISYGNVLYEAAKLVQGEVIAGAYIPMGHTFLSGDCSFSYDRLQPMIERTHAPQRARIPKTRKDLLADIFPALRSRIGVTIIRHDSCNQCGMCTSNCPVGAIKDGKPNARCIRCLRCVTDCPRNALEFKNSRILDVYLKHHHKEDFLLFL